MPESEKVYSVTELNRRVKELFEKHFPTVTVCGEISGLRRYPSGHWYFTLKDSTSEINCAMFSQDNRRVTFEPEDGNVVLAHARVDLYLQRGRYQLVIQDMAPHGQGDLLERLEALKRKLRAEGLFEDSQKQPLPRYPKTIGVITSAESAALRDIVRTLQRRWPPARLRVYPATVQGAEALRSLQHALEKAVGDPHPCEVLIVARGGGSIEDLMAFNDETFVRAIAACPIPLITGIGHETDTTLSDHAADVRAATPTAAAELVSPNASELREHGIQTLQRMHAILSRRLEQTVTELERQQHRLNRMHPIRQIETRQQRLDDLYENLTRTLFHKIESYSQRLDLMRHRLSARSPQQRLKSSEQTLSQFHWRLQTAVQRLYQAWNARLEQATHTLEVVSPLNTLKRGYALATLRTPEGSQLLRSSRQAHRGDAIEVRLGEGQIEAQVTQSDSEEKS